MAAENGWQPPPRETENRALRGAWLKGRAAREAGEPIDACPYDDKRKSDGRLTWSRSFRLAWLDGWRSKGAEDGK